MLLRGLCCCFPSPLFCWPPDSKNVASLQGQESCCSCQVNVSTPHCSFYAILLVKFCSLHLNYSNHCLEDILLTHCTLEKHLNHKFNLEWLFLSDTLAKYSLSTPLSSWFLPPLPYLDIYSFFSSLAITEWFALEVTLMGRDTFH